MGFFQRLFGKKDAPHETARSRANITFSQAPAPLPQVLPEPEPEAVSPQKEEPALYPILKSGDWVGLQTGVVHHTLIGTEEDPLLVVAFGYDHLENIVFVMQEDLKEEEQKQLMQQAYENLENEDVPFTILENTDQKIGTASGFACSSDKLLSPAYMRRVQEQLGASELLVSVARRTCLLAVDREAGPEIHDAFLTMHDTLWNDDSHGNAPIRNAALVVRDGRIKDFIPLD